MPVELIYDAGCPNVSRTRTQLLRAFVAIGATPRWQEWERGASGSPAYVRDCLSPTLLVSGCDVAEEHANDSAGQGCRIYRDESGNLQPFPSLESIQHALRKDFRSKAGTDWKSSLAAFPAIGFALLPKLTCPVCWPAYAGILSALGLGFVDYTPYLLPLTAVFLAITLVLLGIGAKRRGGYAPLLVGMASSVIVLVGKFAYDSNVALYSSITLLVGASLWNAWPRQSSTRNCPVCAQDSTDLINEHNV